MARASITLPNGTVVTIEGTPEEVQQLLKHYGDTGGKQAPVKSARKAGSPRKPARAASVQEKSPVDLAAIVNLVKTCDEAIESTILDRSSQVNRTLLPLYVVHEYMNAHVGLSSGDVSRVTRDLGVPITQPNASRTLSTTASKYVMGDGVRKKGSIVRYKLSRRGLQYLKAVIGGSSGGE